MENMMSHIAKYTWKQYYLSLPGKNGDMWNMDKHGFILVVI